MNTVNFAFEAWTRINGEDGCEGNEPLYGYVLYPWVIEGVLGDQTFQNGVANFTVNARTRRGSGWGTGPYDVVLDSGGSASELLTPISSLDHRHLQVTRVAPPDATCGCEAIGS